MSEDHLDEYEHYNFEQDKITNTGHSGKQRSKKEVSDRSIFNVDYLSLSGDNDAKKSIL